MCLVRTNALLQEQATPLHCASHEGHDSVVELLLDKNANPNAPNKAHIPPHAHCNHHGMDGGALRVGVIMMWQR